MATIVDTEKTLPDDMFGVEGAQVIYPSLEQAAGEHWNWESENEQAASTEASTDVPRVRPFVRISLPPTPERRFKVLQQWEGVVTETTDDSFWTDITDLTHPSNAPEVAEIPLSEISKADQSLVKEGGIFYWVIGYESTKGGQLRRVSEIRFRRFPAWTQRDLDIIKSRAKTTLRELDTHASA
jgi:hypothetical protein